MIANVTFNFVAEANQKDMHKNYYTYMYFVSNKVTNKTNLKESLAL